MREVSLVADKELLIAGRRVVSNFLSFVPESIDELLELEVILDFAEHDALSTNLVSELGVRNLMNVRWYVSLNQKYWAVRSLNTSVNHIEHDEDHVFEFMTFKSVKEMFSYMRAEIVRNRKLSLRLYGQGPNEENLVSRFVRRNFNGTGLEKGLDIVLNVNVEEDLGRVDIATLVFAYFYNALSPVDRYSKSRIEEELMYRMTENHILDMDYFGAIYRDDLLTLEELQARRTRGVRILNEYLTNFPLSDHHVCKQSLGIDQVRYGQTCSGQSEAIEFLRVLSDDELVELTWVYFGYVGRQWDSHTKFLISVISERLYNFPML